MSDKRKQKLERATAILRGSSGEPIITGTDYRIELMHALNWYNANEEYKVLRKYAEQYCLKNDFKDCMHGVKEASDLEIKHIGVIGRLILRGQHVEQEHVSYINNKLAELKQKYKKVKHVEVINQPQQPVLSIQEKIQQAAYRCMEDIDVAIDSFTQTKHTDFSTKSYLLSNSISGAVAKRIGELYQPLYRELGETISGKDEQLVEAYSFLTKAQLKKFYEFVQSIIQDCSQQVVTAKSNRMPRKRKAKPASVIVQKLKYMKELVELKLKSINPADIVGASELWVYNNKYRKLTVYRADGGGLSVKGTTIINYDVSQSESKMLRKPEEYFKALTSTGKRAMQSAFKEIKTKGSQPNGRINEETVLVAVN